MPAAPIIYLKRDGSNENSDCNIGNFKFTAQQLVSSIADGTTPLLITSTTKVTNLNADYIDGVHVGSLTSTRLIRYNSTGTTLENATVTETSGALGGITTLNMSGQLTNTLATNSAPFVVSSITVCTNLNADMLDGKHTGTSGNVVPLLDGTNTWSATNTFRAITTGASGTGYDVNLWSSTAAVEAKWDAANKILNLIGSSGKSSVPVYLKFSASTTEKASIYCDMGIISTNNGLRLTSTSNIFLTANSGAGNISLSGLVVFPTGTVVGFGTGFTTSIYSISALLSTGGMTGYTQFHFDTPNDTLITGAVETFIFNHQGNDVDLRYAGDTETHLLYIDGGAGIVSIGGDLTVNKNSSLGAEKVTNGTFATDTDWTYAAANWTWNAGGWMDKDADGGGTLYQDCSVVAGRIYKLVFTCTGASGLMLPFCTVSCGGVTIAAIGGDVTGYYCYFKAVSTGSLTFDPDNDSRLTIDDVSLKEVTAGDLVVCGEGHFHDVLYTEGRILNVVTKTSAYTATTDDDVIICNSSTAFTIDLPDASGSGRRFIIKNINTGVVTVDGESTDTIDDATTQILGQYDSITIIDYVDEKWVII